VETGEQIMYTFLGFILSVVFFYCMGKIFIVNPVSYMVSKAKEPVEKQKTVKEPKKKQKMVEKPVEKDSLSYDSQYELETPFK
jgi:predicted membrane protein